MKESASLIDRPALAAEEWTSVADYYTRIKEYCLNPMEVLESKGYQRETFPSGASYQALAALPPIIFYQYS
jgi:hypothetical protein